MQLFGLTRIFSIILGCGYLLVFAAEGLAFPRLDLYPVELKGYVGSALRVVMDLPCGASFYGLVAQERGKDTLEVAAAVAQDRILCASVPQQTEVLVDHLAITDFKVIAPMTVTPGKTRLAIASIQSLQVIRKTKAQPRLKATYESRCGSVVGTLIRQTGAQQLEIAVAERPSGMPVAACRARPKARSISVLDLKPRLKVKALRDRPESLARVFELRLAPVRLPDLAEGRALGSQKSRKKGLTLEYQRACNEAPVGIVVDTSATDTRIAKVGMLVARYFNFPCPDEAKAPRWDKYVELSLKLAQGTALMALTTDRENLALRTPLKLARKRHTSTIRVEFPAACGDSYVVYGRDMRGKLAVGILTSKPADAVPSSCKKAAGEVSLAQSNVAPSVKVGELVPMRLRGSSHH